LARALHKDALVLADEAVVSSAEEGSLRSAPGIADDVVVEAVAIGRDRGELERPQHRDPVAANSWYSWC
jgi:hypothetical protein